MDVKNLRENLGISQNELAKLCGVTVRTIQNWEKGKPVPPAMELLLKNIEANHKIIQSGGASSGGVSVAAGEGSQVTLNKDMQQFFATLERQQDIMSRQLEELAQTRLLVEKKDAQIDLLLKMIQGKQ